MDGKAERDRKRAEERRLLRETWGRCCLLACTVESELWGALHTVSVYYFGCFANRK